MVLYRAVEGLSFDGDSLSLHWQLLEVDALGLQLILVLDRALLAGLAVQNVHATGHELHFFFLSRVGCQSNMVFVWVPDTRVRLQERRRWQTARPHVVSCSLVRIRHQADAP